MAKTRSTRTNATYSSVNKTKKYLGVKNFVSRSPLSTIQEMTNPSKRQSRKNFVSTNKIHSVFSRRNSIQKMKKPEPVFRSTDGEEIIESNFTALIDLMGSSLYDIYVYHVLNKALDKKIQLQRVERIANERKLQLSNGNPTIFYGSGKGTHYTCTIDGTEMWDPYKYVQKDGTDHFCQTFALMKIEHAFFPEGYVGKKFGKLVLHLCTFKTPTFRCAINNSLIFVFYLTFSL